MASAARYLGDPARPAATAVSAHRGGVEIVGRFADEWRGLCGESIDDQPFYRPEWIAAHIRAFTPKAKVVLFAVRVEGRLCLVLPLLEERALFCGVPVKRLRAPVNGHSCRFDAVRRRGAHGEVAVTALWEHLRELSGWDLLEFEGIPSGGTLAAVASTAAQEGFLTGQVAVSESPYVPLPPDLAGLSELPVNKKLCSQLRGIRRNLGDGGRLKLQRAGKADRAALQRFYQLEAAGWKGARGTAIASARENLQFYDAIAESAEKLGWLSIYLLELDGRLLAGHFGLSYKGRYFSPKVAYDEGAGQWAPGHLIVEEIVRDCVARGVQEYDITGQNDPWKRKWTLQTRGQCMQYIFGKGISGRLAQWMRIRVRPGVKKFMDRVLR
jgi:CelD/BcsL family acetyltransferase involved in cellulose biosynthesis